MSVDSPRLGALGESGQESALTSIEVGTPAEQCSRRGQVRIGGPNWARVIDGVVLVLLVCLATPQLVHHARHSDPLLATSFVLSVLLIAPMIARRRFPLSVLGLTATLVLVQGALEIRLIASVGLLIAVYTVASRCPMRVSVPAAALAAATAFPVALRAAPGFEWADVLSVVSAVVLAAALCGAYVRNRVEAVATLAQTAYRLEQERDQQALLAAAQERARIAREMHDIIAHSLSVMVTLSDAAAIKAPSAPADAVTAMNRVAAVGRQALNDSRGVLGVLRDDETVLMHPQPGLSDLEALIDLVRHGGCKARLTVNGPMSAVPTAVGLAAYRIAQEAVTNTIKHARGATRLDMSVGVTAGKVTVLVHDDGDGGEVELDGQRSGGHSGHLIGGHTGHGILGMRERAAVFGGSVNAGFDASGWVVRAELRLVPAVVPPVCGTNGRA